MVSDKTKIWAKAHTLSPLTLQFCSDTTQYHTMTVTRGTVVSVGQMPKDLLGKDREWCVIVQRTKGYYVIGFCSTDKAKTVLKSIRNLKAELEYEPAKVHQSLAGILLTTLQNGVSVEGKKLNKTNFDAKLIASLKAFLT